MVSIDTLTHKSNAGLVCIAFCILLLAVTACSSKHAVNGSTVDNKSAEAGFYSIPQFDGAGQDFVIQQKTNTEESKPNSSSDSQTKAEQIKNGQSYASQETVPISPELAAKCEKVYNLSKDEQLKCLAFYQAADASLQNFEQEYDEQRFFPVPDELGTYQNLTSENVELTVPERNIKAPSSEVQSVIVLDRSNKTLLAGIDLSTLESGVIVKNIPKRKPLVVDFDEQNATIRLPNITSPYVIISIDDWALDDVISMTTLIDKSAVIPQIIALDDSGRAVAELEGLVPEYQPESLIKYAKLNYTIPRMMLGDDVTYLLVAASSKTYDINKSKQVKPSKYGRLIFRR